MSLLLKTCVVCAADADVLLGLSLPHRLRLSTLNTGLTDSTSPASQFVLGMNFLPLLPEPWGYRCAIKST